MKIEELRAALVGREVSNVHGDDTSITIHFTNSTSFTFLMYGRGGKISIEAEQTRGKKQVESNEGQ